MDAAPSRDEISWISWIGGLLLTLAVGGCARLEQSIADSDLVYVWAAVPFALVLVAGGLFVGIARGQSIKQWRLDVAASDPGYRSIVVSLVVGVVIVAIAFTIWNLLAQIADQQKMANIGLWWLGSIIGGIFALIAGLTLGERGK